MNELLAGTGRCDITPAPGAPQGGWGAQTHQRGAGADMPLYATALALESGNERVVIVDVDSIGFDDEWTGKILDAIQRLTNLPRERIRMSCTHTHSGPNTFRLATISEGREMIVSYLDGLPDRIAGAAWQAQQNMRPVRCTAGKGRAEISVNRRLRLPDGKVVIGRNWEGAVDHTVRVVRIDDYDEQPLATIVHYACHGTTISWQNRFATPDYPGVVRSEVEKELGGLCLFLQGAAGCVGPRRGFTGDLCVYHRLGKIVGFEACKVATGLETLPREEKLVGLQESGATIALYEDQPVVPNPPVLRVLSRTLKLPAKQFSSPEVLEREAQALRDELERLRGEGTEAEIRAATARAVQAGARADRARLYHGVTHIERQLMGIRIGEVALLSIPGEPFIEISQRIEQSSPFACTLFSGYSNGGFGYLPTTEAFAEGGYEVEATPFAPGAAEIVIRESLQMLRQLAAEGTTA